MEIFLLFSVIIIAILLIGRDLIYSAKRNLFKDHAAWSGKDIKIKYSNSSSREATGSKEKENYLKIIADESKVYLEDQSK
tara:strand:+ start:550 stop:789 length:240 start_codon:yes stop_codon:yes gene_type:complete